MWQVQGQVKAFNSNTLVKTTKSWCDVQETSISSSFSLYQLIHRLPFFTDSRFSVFSRKKPKSRLSFRSMFSKRHSISSADSSEMSADFLVSFSRTAFTYSSESKPKKLAISDRTSDRDLKWDTGRFKYNPKAFKFWNVNDEDLVRIILSIKGWDAPLICIWTPRS